jgi:TIR domain
MPKVSISYRRSDSQDITGRIFDRLVQHFGRESIFRDIDNIRPGIDFRKQISEALQSTNVLLVVVGPRWFGAEGAARSRLENEADPVRLEVEMALKREIPVIPILVGKASMPETTELPECLKDFAFRHAVAVDGGLDFDNHLSRLIRDLDRIFADLPGAKKIGGRWSAVMPRAPKSTPFDADVRDDPVVDSPSVAPRGPSLAEPGEQPKRRTIRKLIFFAAVVCGILLTFIMNIYAPSDEILDMPAKTVVGILAVLPGVVVVYLLIKGIWKLLELFFSRAGP